MRERTLSSAKMTTSNTAESSADIRNKDGSISRMRSHKGNRPTLPQTQACPHCSARFTRSTHLNRHLKNHTNERHYKCLSCPAQFTRSDLLARHRKNCEDPNRLNRPRACLLCTESKVKCDRQDPQCSRCKSRGRECSFAVAPRKKPPPDADEGTLSVLTASEPFATASTSSLLSAEKHSREIDPLSRPLDSLSQQLADLPTLAVHDDPLPPALVHSHLSPLYENDIFQPLFNDVFYPSASSTLDDSLLSLPSLSQIPFQSSALPPPWFRELVAPPTSFPQTESEQRSLLNNFFSREFKAADPKHYLYLFFNAFATQMPIVHSATFKLEDKPSYLLTSMKACGALFIRTHNASVYIKESLAAVRDGLAQAFTKTLTEPIEQVHLLIAVVLLQTIGLWHQNPDERATSSFYHTMLVAMIRRTGLMSKNYAWKPTKTDDKVQLWHDWASHEMTKRALTLAYLHDCCQPIFFGLPPSYNPGEVTLQLPCEQPLWRAGSAQEWFSILSTSSPSEDRLTGPDFSTNLASMNDPQFTPTFLSCFAHFVLIHTILRDLFAACSQTINVPSDPPSPAILTAQHALHNWLRSWTTSHVHYQPDPEDPSFFENVLPFYWLGQVAILAHQEGLPPFNSTNNNETGEVRFKMVKRWLRRIQAFLDEGDGESTLFWDELMKIRLQTWQLEYDADGGTDDQEGLLGFFPT
ncbi:fungal-specific transcription factor domain-containing protein [Mycena capillaripes]|nr:fungal-specific transcription factor domain-containing protein [Mycena capillaripes]